MGEAKPVIIWAMVRQYQATAGYLKPERLRVIVPGSVPAIGVMAAPVGQMHFGAWYSPTSFVSRDGYRLLLAPAPLLLGYLTTLPRSPAQRWTVRRIPLPADRLLLAEHDYQRLVKRLGRVFHS